MSHAQRIVRRAWPGRVGLAVPGSFTFNLDGTGEDPSQGLVAFGPRGSPSRRARIEGNYAATPITTGLAKVWHLSVSPFIRKFRKLMHTTPQKYVNKVRMSHACRALMQTDHTIARVAMDVGLCDHSYFARRF